ncbi:hypothetical protein WJX79_009738 [Trebouxia sp. C0005]|nr:MAG: hypothetical protein FRX49_11145 [Trebouxia sp. A1-2]
MSSGPLTKQYVSELFHNLETGQAPDFLSRVADNVDWTIKGTHPLAGHYSSRKAFQEGALAKIGAGLKEPLKLKVNNILVDGDWAAVEMSAVGAVSKQGWPFDNEYCWVCRFDQGTIVQARAYLDSAMVARLVNEQ